MFSKFETTMASVKHGGRRPVPLGRTFDPRSIAIVGASAEPGAISHFVLSNLERHGYQGELYLISRNRTEINARPCLKSLQEMPSGVDVVVLCIPEAGVMDAVRTCVEKDVGGVVIFASGYGEAGEEGRARQDALAAVARDSGLVLIGPNCMGYGNYCVGVPVTFEPLVPLNRLAERQGISIVAQSGAMAINMRDAMLARWLPIAKVASTGNEAGVSVEDYVAHYIADGSTSVIGIYAEQIRYPELFLTLAEQARSARKPLVLLMPGRSARAKKAAASHTGALAGDHATITAVLRGAAVVVVETQDELYDVLAVLSRYPRPQIGGTAVVTGSGAIKNLSIDFAEAVGLSLPEFAEGTVNALTEMLPDYAVVENPLDYTTVLLRDPKIVGRLIDMVIEDSHIGSLVATLISGPEQGQKAKALTMVPALANRVKPTILVALGDSWPLCEEFVGAVRDGKVLLFRSLERALRTLNIVHAHAADVERAARRDMKLPDVQALPSPVPSNGIFAEFEGKQWLSRIGLNVPAGRLATTLDEALDIASVIGYPVVLKAQASELPHKSEVGGVKVGLADPAALSHAWDEINGNIAAYRPNVRLDGLLVEAMGSKGLELIVGARRDEAWGPVVMVGLGGIWIETLKDVRLIPPGLLLEDIVSELRQLKAAPLLNGVRGSSAVDVRAIARVVQALGAQMRANRNIVEVDVNPLVAYPDNVVALDALLVCQRD